MPLPDAPDSLHSRVSVLENDMQWVRATTTDSVKKLTEKMDLLLEQMAVFQTNIKKEIKSDLSAEFEQRFVPKKVIWVAMGVSGGIGLVAGASFQSFLKPLISIFVS